MARKIFGTFMLLLFAVSLMGTVGCTKYATEEDLRDLEEARQAAISAENEQEAIVSERVSLEKERDAKKAELEALEQELERLKRQ